PVRTTDAGPREHPERALRPRFGPVLAERRRAARADPDRPAEARREARAPDRRAERDRRPTEELRGAVRLAGCRPAARRANDLPSGRTGDDHPVARRDDRGTGPPIPQPTFGRAVRDGALREPRARRRRAALATRSL